MSGLIGGAASILQGNAQKYGGASGLGTGQSFINALDPINLFGGSSSSVLGNLIDPGNILGFNPQMATNPRLQQGMNNGQNSGIPTTLPTLPGIGAPQTYSSQLNGGYANLGPGVFNQMASQLAGQMYSPQKNATSSTSNQTTPPDNQSTPPDNQSTPAQSTPNQTTANNVMPPAVFSKINMPPPALSWITSGGLGQTAYAMPGFSGAPIGMIQYMMNHHQGPLPGKFDNPYAFMGPDNVPSAPKSGPPNKSGYLGPPGAGGIQLIPASGVGTGKGGAGASSSGGNGGMPRRFSVSFNPGSGVM